MRTSKGQSTQKENLMRIFVVLICSLGLVSVAYGAQQEENKQKKKQPQAVQHAPAATTAHPTGHPTGAGANPKHTSMEAYHGQQGTYHAQKVIKGQTSTEAYHGQKGIKGHPSTEAYHGQKGNKGQTSTGANEVQTGKAAKGGKVTGATAATGKAATGKPPKVQHFDLPKQPNTAKAPAVTFQQGRHIEGSQNWQGQQYTVFRNYRSEWHDQNWWDSHYHNNIVFVFGAPYYWNAGYWFPAWGYSPNAYYAWDGPIYAYNHLPPDQVIANVQAALQEQGYYHGEVDGLIGPLTREAVANYQRDHGLYETASIDQPTLESLGMT
jgi:putative peptidoglycan binding protein